MGMQTEVASARVCGAIYPLIAIEFPCEGPIGSSLTLSFDLQLLYVYLTLLLL